MPFHPDDRPAFRPLETRQVDDPDRPGVAVTDPLGLFDGTVFLPAPMLPLIARIDGQRSVLEIEQELRAAGHPVADGDVAQVVEQLDEALLLHGELFRNTLERTVEEYVSQDPRPPRHAGSNGYPRDPEACREHLADWLPADLHLGIAPIREAPPAGLIAPHIDLGRGREGYVAAYREIQRAETADLYVVLGTAHHGLEGVLSGWTNDWMTATGKLATDREFVARVHGALGDLAPNEPFDRFAHRQEHSLEFQMLWLGHALRGRSEGAQVAGFLFSGLPHAAGDPEKHPEGERCLRVLREAVDERRQQGERVTVISGADLAHIGPDFGDEHPIDDERADLLRRADLGRLGFLLDGDPLGFHRAVLGPGNPDRICSAPSITTTATCAASPARLLHYGQAREPDDSQLVSFVAALFPAP